MANWPAGMDWPPDGDEAKYGPWLALADGAEVQTADGRGWQLSVVDCGDLVVPTGHLVACDPFSNLEDALDGPFVRVPPGKYPVRVTVADVSGKRNGSHLRHAYLSLLLGDGPEVRRTYQSGVGVDAGTVCFVDAAVVRAAMPPNTPASGQNAWWNTWAEITMGWGRRRNKRDSWAARMADPHHIGAGLANVPLPLGQSGENVVLAKSGWGDGGYPVIGGYAATGALVAVHVDLYVVASANEVDEDDGSAGAPAGDPGSAK
jgi:hypothetical protein